MTKYRVIKDTREKRGWYFRADGECLGYIEHKLNTGDYSVEGYEDKISIERKGSIDEFANNVKQPRFFRELERLNKIEHAYLVLEFGMFDLLKYPETSKLNPKQKALLRINAGYLFKQLMKIYNDYPNIKIVFCGGKIHAFLFTQKLFESIINATSRDSR